MVANAIIKLISFLRAKVRSSYARNVRSESLPFRKTSDSANAQHKFDCGDIATAHLSTRMLSRVSRLDLDDEIRRAQITSANSSPLGRTARPAITTNGLRVCAKAIPVQAQTVSNNFINFLFAISKLIKASER